MWGLLFAIESMCGLVAQLRRAGWVWRRADQRAVYWCLVGIGLGLLVGLRPVLPYSLAGFAFGILGAAFLYGVIADWQGWWKKTGIGR